MSRAARRAWLKLKRRAAATPVASALSRRWRATRAPEPLPLDRVRRRLELLVAAMYGRPIPIDPVLQPRKRGPAPVPASDGVGIRLPATMDAGDGDAAALARYRLLAIEQAERVVRGTAELAPPSSAPLERDLFLLREAALIDRSIARRVRGADAALAAARASALGARPVAKSLNEIERGVETLVRRVLAAGPTEVPPELAIDTSAEDSPAESVVWAQAAAARLRAGGGSSLGAEYRGLPPVSVWGTVTEAGDATTAGAGSATGSPRVHASRRAQAGTARRADPATQPAEEAKAGKRRALSSRNSLQLVGPVEGRDGPPSGQATPVVVAGDATIIGSVPSGDPRDALPDSLPGSHRRDGATAPPHAGAGDGIQYPEWDWRDKRYRTAYATVYLHPAPESDAAKEADMRQQYASIIRRVRERFERMQSRRTRSTRQRDGDDLDLAACVNSLVDRRLGRTPDDRLYVAVRPGRRPVAIVLLVDASGSATDPVSATRRVIDVEKAAVLLASEALDALGDPYAVLTFSSRGAGAVRMTTVKDFSERNSDRARRRVWAISPQGNTRLGAAVRHATALLARQSAGHRLLLIVSDGKPNDIDGYNGQYAIEDSRQAVLEARAHDIVPFCLTVDREEPEYAPHIFGPTGYTVLRHAEQLPLVLLAAVRRLLQS